MSTRAYQAAVLGQERSDVPWDARSTSAPASTDDLVAQFRAKGGQVKRMPSGRKTLNDRQVELLCRGEYAMLAVETVVQEHVRKHTGRSK